MEITTAFNNYDLLSNLKPFQKLIVVDNNKLELDSRWVQSIRRKITGNSKDEILEPLIDTFHILIHYYLHVVGVSLENSHLLKTITNVGNVLKQTYPNWDELSKRFENIKETIYNQSKKMEYIKYHPTQEELIQMSFDYDCEEQIIKNDCEEQILKNDLEEQFVLMEIEMNYLRLENEKLKEDLQKINSNMEDQEIILMAQMENINQSYKRDVDKLKDDIEKLKQKNTLEHAQLKTLLKLFYEKGKKYADSLKYELEQNIDSLDDDIDVLYDFVQNNISGGKF